MEQIIPWKELTAAAAPYYSKVKDAGRPPIAIERMLRIHFLQHWFALSDPGIEEVLSDSRAMRRFIGIDLGKEPVPDETTVRKFRHLTERYNLGDELFRLVSVYLEENGFKAARGAIVDAAIVSAPGSTLSRACRKGGGAAKRWGIQHAVKGMAHFEEETSNRLFQTLEEWDEFLRKYAPFFKEVA